MKNAELIIKNNDGLSNDIWNCKSDFNKKEWELAIKNFVENLESIYEDAYSINENCIELEDDRLYILGDTINFLKSFSIIIKEN